MKKRFAAIIIAVIMTALLCAVAVYADSAITVTGQPEDIEAPVGSTGSATVEADGATGYRWYFKSVKSSSWQPSGMKGYNTDTIYVPVTTARLGQQYKCVLTDDDGHTVETKAVVVKAVIPGVITIVEEPSDISAPFGTTGSATVTASVDNGAALSYQWYFKNSAVKTWTPSGFEGNKTDTIRVPVAASRVGQQYKCVITTSDGGMAETRALTVLKQEPSVITVVTQPSDIRAQLGSNGFAKVTAQTDTGAQMTYQWYFLAKGSTEWKPSGFMGNKTSMIFVPVAAGRIGQQYKCVITTADGGRAETDPVSVMEPEPSVITIVTQPSDIKARLGAEGTAMVEAETDTGAAMAYQWYFLAKGSTEWKTSGFTGSRTATITVPVAAGRIGQQYKCVITTVDGGRAETDPVAVAPLPTEITIDSEPADLYAAIGENATATVEASGDSAAVLSYQWYFLAKGSTEWKASGFTGSRTATITVPVEERRIGQQYKCVITTADGGRAESGVITVYEKPALDFRITGNPDSYRMYPGDPVDLHVTVSVDTGKYPVSYQWYKDGEKVIGATGRRLFIASFTPEDAGEYYCVVSGYGYSATSKTATVRMLG